jgi:hypothetical protein
MATPHEPPPGPRRWQDELTVLGDELVARVRELLQEGNVRRIIISHEGRTMLEIPLTLGVVGALLAPQIAALGAMAALLTRCTLTVEREAPEASGTPPPPSEAAPPRAEPPPLATRIPVEPREPRE